jgi:Flp pilus assembly protein TadG
VSRQAASSFRREDGTASVEMVAVVPFLLLAVLVAAQIGLAGEALWSAGVAARAGARAALVGGDTAVAARAALPSAMRDGAEVSTGDAVSVRVGIPRLLPGLPRLTVGAKATLEPGDG